MVLGIADVLFDVGTSTFFRIYWEDVFTQDKGIEAILGFIYEPNMADMGHTNEYTCYPELEIGVKTWVCPWRIYPKDPQIIQK